MKRIKAVLTENTEKKTRKIRCFSYSLCLLGVLCVCENLLVRNFKTLRATEAQRTKQQTKRFLKVGDVISNATVQWRVALDHYQSANNILSERHRISAVQ